MSEYLEQTNPNNINFYSWHAFSKLNFLEASSEWMKNLNEIIKIKKGLSSYQVRVLNEDNKIYEETENKNTTTSH